MASRLEAEASALAPRGAGRRWLLPAAIALVLLSLGGGLWWFSGRAAKSLSPQKPIPKEPVISDKSIAVLPFENLSEEKQNTYFADGIQDEILTRLSKIADLKVISRTSTLRCKSAPESLSAIGKELGVANILEGSVQKSGNQVRVNVQLIKAANDSHLWAETYDRELPDIFRGSPEDPATRVTRNHPCRGRAGTYCCAAPRDGSR